MCQSLKENHLFAFFFKINDLAILQITFAEFSARDLFLNEVFFTLKKIKLIPSVKINLTVYETGFLPILQTHYYMFYKKKKDDRVK